MDHEALRDDLPAAALGALPAADLARVERHAAACATCAEELAELRSGGLALALSAPPLQPPAELRGRVLAAAAAEPPPRGRVLPFRRGLPSAAVWGSVAAALLVSSATAAWAASVQREVEPLRAKAERYDRVVRVLGSDRLTTVALRPARDGELGRGTVWLDPSSSAGMVMVHNLPPLPEDRAWQLWFVRSATGERRSGGLLRTDASGTGYTIVQCPADLRTFDVIGVTDEPHGGSETPTTERVLTARLD